MPETRTKGDQTRDAVVRRGVQAAYRVGLERLTIGELAAATGLSKSGLYAHFGSKEALQLEVLDRARADFVDHVVRPALAVPRGRARVTALFEHWLVAARSRLPGSGLFVKAVAEYEEQDGPIRSRLVAHHRDYFDTVAQIFATGIATGDFDSDADPGQFATDVFGVILAYYHGVRLLDPATAEHRARRAFAALLAAASPTTPSAEGHPR